MQTSDLWIVGARLLDPAAGLDEEGSIHVVDGVIVAVERGRVTPAAGSEVVDGAGLWLTPGFIDLRASLREPGFEQKETLLTGLRAAAAGGFTAVCASPDTRPHVDSAPVVADLLARAERVGGARLLPVGCATRGLDDTNLAPIGELSEAGCVALSQGEHPISTASLMRNLLEYAGGFGMVVFHSPAEPTLEGLVDEGPWSTRLGLPSAPAAAEAIAVSRDLLLAELTGQRLHLQRLSTAAAIDLVRQARARGVPVTCDVTPHHLHLTAAALAEFDPNAKVRPPLRSDIDVAALRAGLGDGTIDAIATDHQPHHAEEKTHEIAVAATGMSALETALPLTLALVEAGAIDASRAVALLTSGPRTVLGLEPGGLQVGATADLTLIDPTRTWIPSPSSLQSMGHNTPWRGQLLRGRSVLTLVGGRVVWRAPEEGM